MIQHRFRCSVMVRRGRRVCLWTLGIVVLTILALAPPSTPVLGRMEDEWDGDVLVTTTPVPLHPLVRTDVRHDISPPLREIAPLPPQPHVRAPRLPALRLPPRAEGDHRGDPVVQSRLSPLTLMPDPLLSFDGVGNVNGVMPPDTQGDIGPNHYVQWVNLSFAIWDKAGNLLYGPANGNTLWSGFGGVCESSNDGDPITLYDPLADRWLMSQFALPNFPYGPFYQCIAISQTPDPTGPWYRYQFLISNTKMNDYPHFGIWPDGYYMSVNQFNAGSLSWAGAGVVAFERDQMLQGNTAQMVYFDLYSVNSMFGGMLPADMDGLTPPPAGAPNYFVEVDDGSPDAMRIWQFHVDWNTPSDSTFGISGQPNAVLPVASFTPICPYTRDCIPQPDTSTGLDAIGDRVMYRLAYRNMGTYETMVVNHTVDAGGGRAGVRWYEVRDPGGTPTIYQQGTFAPSDGLYRWMGSIAMDHTGNIALGYSVSSNTVYPSIRYTGRLADDPLGEMTQGEATLVAGGGSQLSGYSRWGDYSMLTVDPTDDCTFWYTQEYYATTSSSGWQTRIGSFKFPNCSMTTYGTLRGTAYDAATSAPVAGVQVQARGADETTETTSDLDGSYAFVLTSGSYTVTAFSYGYEPLTIHNVTVAANTTTTLDLPLRQAATHVVSGFVTDAATGWPLHARLDIDGYPLSPVWSDPVTGFYSVTLAEWVTYTFRVTAWADGYTTASRTVGPLTSTRTENFALTVNAEACSAPGYSRVGGTCTPPADGGLAVGQVYDANNGEPLAGAVLVTDEGEQAVSAATEDPSVGNGFYTLFASPGAHVLTATLTTYGAVTETVTVTSGGTVRRDLSLPAGELVYAPDALTVTLAWGGEITVPLTLTNDGGWPLTFTVAVLAPAPTTTAVIQYPDAVVKPFKQHYSTTRRLPTVPLPFAPTYEDAGVILAHWTLGPQRVWGVAPVNGTVWVGSPSSMWGGDSRLYEVTPGGQPTGRTHALTWGPRFGPADAAVDWYAGRVWVMEGDFGKNCIYEVDPVWGYTGRKVCPQAIVNALRGLAYDPTDDTWYAGGWSDGLIYHFDTQGRLVEATYVGLPISGLAYNPRTAHLFALTNAEATFVYVLDAANEYAILGRFPVAGMEAYAGAGLEMDRQGKLWAVDQEAGVVYRFTSGETAMMKANVAWVAVTPTEGALAPGAGRVISVTFDANTLSLPDWGEHYARLKIVQSTPYPPAYVPVTLSVAPPPPTFTISLAPATQPVEVGTPFSYAVVLTNTGGPATEVTIAAPLPAEVTFAGAEQDGTLENGAVVWHGLTVGYGTPVTFSFAVTLTCVPSGTQVVGATPWVTATEHTTPTQGVALPVTAVHEGVRAAFNVPALVLSRQAAIFGNLSVHGTAFVWDFGDGATSTVAIPAHTYARSGVYTVSLTATNACSTDVYSHAVRVEDYALRLEAPVAEVAAYPGEAASYTLRVLNTGTLSDVFALTITAPWTASLSVSEVGPLAPGGAITVTAVVTVPTEALAGEAGRVRVLAHPRSDPRSPRAEARAWMTTTVRAVHGVEATPVVMMRRAQPGEAVSFSISAANTGNITETYTPTLSGGLWSASLVSDVPLTLAPREEKVVQVRVQVPVTATALEQSVTVLTLRGTSGVTATAELVAGVTCLPVQDASFTFAPASPEAGEWVTFTGSVRVGTPPISYTWVFDDGETASGQVVTHTYVGKGDYRAVMVASNCLGTASSMAAHVVSVSGEPSMEVTPEALAVTVWPGGAVTATLTVRNPGGADLTWAMAPLTPMPWASGTAAQGIVRPQQAERVVLTFTVPASAAVGTVYTGTLRVTGDALDVPEVVVPVTLRVTPPCEPVEGAAFVYAPTSPRAGQRVVFTGTVSSGSATLPLTYTWQFGDGYSATVVSGVATHAYALAGTYTVTMEVANFCSSDVAQGVLIVQEGFAVYLPLIVRGR